LHGVLTPGLTLGRSRASARGDTRPRLSQSSHKCALLGLQILSHLQLLIQGGGVGVLSRGRFLLHGSHPKRSASEERCPLAMGFLSRQSNHSPKIYIASSIVNSDRWCGRSVTERPHRRPQAAKPPVSDRRHEDRIILHRQESCKCSAYATVSSTSVLMRAWRNRRLLQPQEAAGRPPTSHHHHHLAPQIHQKNPNALHRD
jgi:hypothetical protein